MTNPVELEKSVTPSKEIVQEMIKEMAKEMAIESAKEIKTLALEVAEDHRRIVHWIRNISQIQFFRMDDVEKFEERVDALENRIKSLEKQLTPENESSKPS